MSEPEQDRPVEEMGYAEATAELGQILAELNSDALDVDELVGRVRRARDLITTCRAKLQSAQLDIAEITAELDPT